MSTRSRWIACAVLCAGVAAHGAEPAIHVPQGAAVAIDGRMNEAEWERAAGQRLPDGTLLRLQHDGRYLYLGIEGGKQGFPSVCVAHGESVRVLHASVCRRSSLKERCE